jgi:hypothetical protein
MNHTVKRSIRKCDETETPIPNPLSISQVVATNQSNPKLMRMRAYFRQLAVVMARGIIRFDKRVSNALLGTWNRIGFSIGFDHGHSLYL